jgi:hypothetical protein
MSFLWRSQKGVKLEGRAGQKDYVLQLIKKVQTETIWRSVVLAPGMGFI